MQAAPTNTRAAAGSSAPTVVQHITLSVNVDEVDDIVKLTNIFQGFAHNQIVFGGVTIITTENGFNFSK